LTKLDTILETKKLLISKVFYILVKIYKMIYILVSKLTTNILDFKLVSKNLFVSLNVLFTNKDVRVYPLFGSIVL